MVEAGSICNLIHSEMHGLEMFITFHTLETHYFSTEMSTVPFIVTSQYNTEYLIIQYILLMFH